ncbi:phage tail protein [Nostoc sp. 'Peltigera malacea cyanobiont' DB3992]|uniref:phage tail protein n=2 Tax=Nostoc TaxID=1177 RepID=UPI00211E22A6|nr:phage tail protein [Nostoc sp. 'Peltigera malacea cyanobiont' DB3992]
MITAYDQKGDEKARWEILRCYPCKYTGPTLTASGGDMANETIELVHEGIKRTK